MQAAEDAGTPFDPEPWVREWDELRLPDIKNKLRKFVVCIDLMGKDREFTKEQKSFIFETVYKFKTHWEDFEKKKLEEDRDALLAQQAEDAEKLLTEEAQEAFKVKEDKLVQDKIDPQPEEEKVEEEAEPKKKLTAKEKKALEEEKRKKEEERLAALEEEEEVPVETKQEWVSEIRMGFQVELLKSDPLIKVRFSDMTKRKVVKYNGLIKALFYFLATERDEVCVPATQKLFWKKARHLWNDNLTKKMSDYVYKGAKAFPVQAYQTLDYVEKQVDAVNYEELSTYNYALAIVHKWLKLALEARRRDVGRRLLGEK